MVGTKMDLGKVDGLWYIFREMLIKTNRYQKEEKNVGKQFSGTESIS